MKFLTALFALLLSACITAAAPVTGELSARISAPATPSTDRGLIHLNQHTSASLYVPASYSPDRPAPFLLLLHGASGRGDNMIRKFKDEADKRGIILLAPDSAGNTWDIALSYSGNSRQAPQFGDDVPRVDAALAQTFSRYAIDPQHAGIAGFSDGAGYALSLGVKNSRLFHSIMAFSAGILVPGDTGPPARIFMSHGRKDHVIPIAVPKDTLAPALRSAGFKVQFVEFDGDHELPPAILSQALDWFLSS
jgi:phospholipase/carboxylesterase